MSDAPAVIDDVEGSEPEEVVDEVDDDEAEEAFQRDEEERANGDEEPAEADDNPNDPDAEIDGEENQEQDLMLPRLKMNMKPTSTKEKSMNAHRP